MLTYVIRKYGFSAICGPPNQMPYKRTNIRTRNIELPTEIAITVRT